MIGPAVEPGTRYGDEALVFLSFRSGASSISADFVLILNDGKAGDGLTRETLIQLIQEEQKR